VYILITPQCKNVITSNIDTVRTRHREGNRSATLLRVHPHPVHHMHKNRPFANLWPPPSCRRPAAAGRLPLAMQLSAMQLPPACCRRWPPGGCRRLAAAGRPTAAGRRPAAAGQLPAVRMAPIARSKRNAMHFLKNATHLLKKCNAFSKKMQRTF